MYLQIKAVLICTELLLQSQVQDQISWTVLDLLKWGYLNRLMGFGILQVIVCRAVQT